MISSKDIFIQEMELQQAEMIQQQLLELGI